MNYNFNVGLVEGEAQEIAGQYFAVMDDNHNNHVELHEFLAHYRISLDGLFEHQTFSNTKGSKGGQTGSGRGRGKSTYTRALKSESKRGGSSAVKKSTRARNIAGGRGVYGGGGRKGRGGRGGKGGRRK